MTLIERIRKNWWNSKHWSAPEKCVRLNIVHPSLLVLSKTFGMWVGRWTVSDIRKFPSISLLWPNGEIVRIRITNKCSNWFGVERFASVDEGPHDQEEYTQLILVEKLMPGGRLTDSSGVTLVNLPSFSSANELRMKLELNGMRQMNKDR